MSMAVHQLTMWPLGPPAAVNAKSCVVCCKLRCVCCRYGPANYTGDSAHPPLWAFSLDGYSIYGRHLSTSNEGYSSPLDDCGGHEHGDPYGYHYHSQVISAYTTSAASKGVVAGVEYPVFPPGVRLDTLI